MATAATTAGAIDTAGAGAAAVADPASVSVGLAVTQPVATATIETSASKVRIGVAFILIGSLSVECLRIKSRRLAGVFAVRNIDRNVTITL